MSAKSFRLRHEAAKAMMSRATTNRAQQPGNRNNANDTVSPLFNDGGDAVLSSQLIQQYSNHLILALFMLLYYSPLVVVSSLQFVPVLLATTDDQSALCRESSNRSSIRKRRRDRSCVRPPHTPHGWHKETQDVAVLQCKPRRSARILLPSPSAAATAAATTPKP